MKYSTTVATFNTKRIYELTLNENAAAANAVVNGLHRRILVDDEDD